MYNLQRLTFELNNGKNIKKNCKKRNGEQMSSLINFVTFPTRYVEKLFLIKNGFSYIIFRENTWSPITYSEGIKRPRNPSGTELLTFMRERSFIGTGKWKEKELNCQ
jgi:hypothetical protein